MPDLSPLYALLALLPFDCMQARFMQQALLGLLLLAPMAAVMGVHVVNFRMAFFSDAISHSAFAGIALGLIFSVDPDYSMPLFGVAVGLGVISVLRNSALSSDTVIGVFFSAVMAFGLAVVSCYTAVARDIQQFLYGDILTLGEQELYWLMLLALLLAIFQFRGYNHLMYIAVHPVLARVHRIKVSCLQYCFAGLLSLVVMFAVKAVGVLLVTALLIVPAATARNFARSAGAMFWWALLVGSSSAIIGLLLSAQDWLRTATGATIILVACGWFILSLFYTMTRDKTA